MCHTVVIDETGYSASSPDELFDDHGLARREGLLTDSAQLVVRQGGIEIASASGRAPHALSVCFSIAHMAPGEASVAELSWAGGSRTPLPGALGRLSPRIWDK